MTHRIIVWSGTLVLEDTGNRPADAGATREWVRKARKAFGQEDNGHQVVIEVRSGAYVASWD